MSTLFDFITRVVDKLPQEFKDAKQTSREIYDALYGTAEALVLIAGNSFYGSSIFRRRETSSVDSLNAQSSANSVSDADGQLARSVSSLTVAPQSFIGDIVAYLRNVVVP